jgi:hypothetical protein
MVKELDMMVVGGRGQREGTLPPKHQNDKDYEIMQKDTTGFPCLFQRKRRCIQRQRARQCGSPFSTKSGQIFQLDTNNWEKGSGENGETGI